MKDGNWVPLSKAFVSYLPKTNQPYTELEAAFSLQVKYDNNETVTTAGLSAHWNWSRKRVVNFIRLLKVSIEYEKDTKIYQRQRGQIAIQKGDRKGAERAQIRFIDSKELLDIGDRKGTERGQKGSRKGSTNNDPDPDPDLKPRKEKKFVPPTVEQVREYMKEIGFNGDAQNFVDSNIAKGWVVGTTRTPMKCWKAAIRTWQQKHLERMKLQQPTHQPSYSTAGLEKFSKLADE